MSDIDYEELAAAWWSVKKPDANHWVAEVKNVVAAYREQMRARGVVEVSQDAIRMLQNFRQTYESFVAADPDRRVDAGSVLATIKHVLSAFEKETN